MARLLVPDRSIALVGLMGSGKTSVGRRLAARLGLPFVDSDEEIERAAGRSVADIFESYGEPEFRDLERRVLARLLSGAPQVIGTGGGAFIDDQTRALMRERCTSIWLRAEIATLVKRVRGNDRRPLLKDKDPETVLTALAAARGPIYAEADIIIASGDRAHDVTVAKIVEALAALHD
jgi:shikimate kinase